MSVTIEGIDQIVANLTALSSSIVDIGIALSAEATYAAYVEYGTRRMSASPYLRPAVDQSLDDLTALVLAGVLEIAETGSEDALRRYLDEGAQMVEDRAKSLVHVVTGNLRASIHGEAY